VRSRINGKTVCPATGSIDSDAERGISGKSEARDCGRSTSLNNSSSEILRGVKALISYDQTARPSGKVDADGDACPFSGEQRRHRSGLCCTDLDARDRTAP
jgi:hypothetical protein